MVLSNIPKKITILITVFLLFNIVLHAQTDLPDDKAAGYRFPAGDFWSLDAGAGMSDLLVRGKSFQFVVDPKIWLSPPLMVGAKTGINYSSEDDGRNILAIDTQVYLRWNFLRLGNKNNPVNIFLQGGLGLLAAYRGNAQEPDNLFKDVTMTRGSVLADAALGVTIPLTERWHLEPLVRGGYPHLLGASITAGYKFRLPSSRNRMGRTEYVEVIRELPPRIIVERIIIFAIEFIIFGPDIGRYNIGIDRDAQGLNELVLNYVAKTLVENPDYVVRIEGHANPVTDDPREADELTVLSTVRHDSISEQLKNRGVREEQIVKIALGGTRTVIQQSDTERWNRNRRVELIIMKIDNE